MSASFVAPPLETAVPPEAKALAFFAKAARFLHADEVAQLRRAYDFSASCHTQQTRRSGEPYIIHPLAVADILADFELDAETLIAALLHDTIEDTGVSKGQIAEYFGRAVAELVDGLSKLEKLRFRSLEEAQAENFRKMLMAMAHDVRVIFVKLADRLHNMRTLDVLSLQKQQRIAAETEEIYAPLANRLGLHGMYQELEDLAFRYQHPMRYRTLSRVVAMAHGNSQQLIDEVLEGIRAQLLRASILAQTEGRGKHITSIYRKMQQKHLRFEDVHDIYGFRVIVKDIPTCYLAVGALHGLYQPKPGGFKDYIAIPKPNGYQSLHTTLTGPSGHPVEVQIRTPEMHRMAQSGMASHWMYKYGPGGSGVNANNPPPAGRSSPDERNAEIHRHTQQWMQSLLEIQSMSGDSAEFLEHVKEDLFPGGIYVMTPKGKILSLPYGATVIDFAYAVHSDVGNRCHAARVNFNLVPLRTVLRTGDRIEIFTAPDARPNPRWLQFVVTGRARSHIRHTIRSIRFEESVQLGERLLTQALRALRAQDIGEPASSTAWERYLREIAPASREQVLSDIGLGNRLNVVVAQRLLSFSGHRGEGEAMGHAPLLIRGTEGASVQIARCCNPIPGDEILGAIKPGQGLVIHQHDCPQLHGRNRGAPDQVLDVEWDHSITHLFDVSIVVQVRHERRVLAQITAAISGADAPIQSVQMENMLAEGQAHSARNTPATGTPQKATHAHTDVTLTIQVENRSHLARIFVTLRGVPSVVHVQRIKPAQI